MKSQPQKRPDKPARSDSLPASPTAPDVTSGSEASENEAGTETRREAIPPASGEAPAEGEVRPEGRRPTGQEVSVEIPETIQKEMEELRKLAAERDEFLKLLQRVQADFLNYQKRIKREKEEWERYKNEDILQQLLNAFDNLDNALKMKCESKEAQCLLEGIDLTKKELLRILEKNGVMLIKTIGEKFDPARHEAVLIVDDTNQPDNTIIEEISPGYLLYDRVLRPARVKVIKRKTTV
jgi:molecular chaperone GrpE